MSAPDFIEYAFARCDRLKTLAQLRKAQKHADRVQGAQCVVRSGTNPIDDQMRWTLGQGDGAFDLMEGWRKAKGSARERATAPICLHLILGVSPASVERVGDLHDRSNPANAALFAAARDFAERKIGTVAAARLDLDEEGGGVVDVFVVPAFERQRRLRKDGTRSPDDVLEISCNKAFERLRKSTGEHGDYAALQSAWADHAQWHLDHRLRRGERKSKTGRRHLETPEFKELMRKTTKLKEEAEAAQAVLDQLAAERQALKDRRSFLEWREAGLSRQEQQYRRQIDQEVRAIAHAWVKCANGQDLTDADRALMNSPMAIEASAVLEASISKVEAEKTAQEEREAHNLREEERVAGLRHAAEARQRELDKREEKVRSDEEAIQTRDAGSRTRAADLEKKESRLGIAEQEAQAASEHGAYLLEEASSLKGRIMAALHAMMRRWRGASEPGDEEILKHADVAGLTEAANVIHAKIETGRHSLEVLNRSVEAETQKMHKLADQQATERSRLIDLKTELDKKDEDILRQQTDLDARNAKISEQEKTHTGAVARHDERVTAEIDRIGRFMLALQQRLIGAPIAEDQEILDDPMFGGIRAQVDATRKALDADIESKRKDRDELVAESDALAQQSEKIKAVGPAIAAWLAGERSDELKAKLGQPEAKLFVDAFKGAFAQMTDHRKRLQAEMTPLIEQIAGLRAGKKTAEENQAEAEKRLAETKAEADVLATLIEANKERAERFERKLTKNMAYLERLAAQHEELTPVPKLMKQIDAAKAQVTEVPGLRRQSKPPEIERD